MTDRQTALLLELDPDLGQLLPEHRLSAAKHELRVVVRVLEPGAWDAAKLAGARPEHIGLLVVEGVIAREVLVSDTVSTELLGPGDVVRPWRLQAGSSLLRSSVRWNVLTRSRVALLDRRLGAELGRYPEIGAVIVDRVDERAARLAVTQAISQLNRVDGRLLALFWHLAERWGRMTPEGVALPMTLSHRMLGQLVGARRPTVSTALAELAKDGEIRRRDDGSWLLTGEPVGVPAPEVERVVPMRRRLLPPQPAAQAAPRPSPGVEMRAALDYRSGGGSAVVRWSAIPVNVSTRWTTSGPGTIAKRKPSSRAVVSHRMASRRPVESMKVSPRRSSTRSRQPPARSSSSAASTRCTLSRSSSPCGWTQAVRPSRAMSQRKSPGGVLWSGSLRTGASLTLHSRKSATFGNGQPGARMRSDPG
jgi:CRP/FNR family transcriptional regulator, cyclic AMP receptor protein